MLRWERRVASNLISHCGSDRSAKFKRKSISTQKRMRFWVMYDVCRIEAFILSSYNIRQLRSFVIF